MKRVVAITVFLAAELGFGTPAAAQKWKGPSEADKRQSPVTVDGFSPNSGGVGTVVTIRGRGFTARTRLLVGGRPVKPTRIQKTAITFKIPAGYGDGAIVLRHPGVGRDIAVGRFSVASSMQITRFSPARGIRGARVEISGSGFGRDVKVLMNGKEVLVNRSAPKRLVVTVPVDATTDYLTVVAKNGARVRSTTMFQVQLPAPTIASVVPESGLPGTRVRITGSNFTAEDKVLYGKLEVPVAGRGAGYVEVTIPMSARKADFLTVQNSNGVVRSAQVFQLDKPAVIKRIAPLSGKAGQRVEIYGSGFKNGDRVTLAGVAVQVVQLRPTQISVLIPDNSRTGPLVIERGPMKVASRQQFELIRTPVVAGFSPAGGRPGARVTISGAHFTRATKVYYGAKKLRVVRRDGDKALVVILPRKAKGEVFRVQTAGGEARSAQAFAIQLPPQVKGADPKQGLPGTEVTFSGKNMTSIGAVLLGDTRMTIVSRMPNKLVAKVPLGATNGRFSVESYGVGKRTRLRFTVLPGPTISLVTPQSGVPGTEVVIEGGNLHPETAVFLGAKPLRVTQRDAGRLVARVPNSTAVGSYSLTLRAKAVEVRAPNKFKVIAPAEITGFKPERADAGSTVTIRGKNFDMSTKVYWGQQLLRVLEVKSDGRRMVVRVPRNSLGARYLLVDSGGVRAQSREMLEVVTPAPRKRR